MIIKVVVVIESANAYPRNGYQLTPVPFIPSLVQIQEKWNTKPACDISIINSMKKNFPAKSTNEYRDLAKAIFISGALSCLTPHSNASQICHRVLSRIVPLDKNVSHSVSIFS